MDLPFNKKIKNFAQNGIGRKRNVGQEGT